MGKSTTGDVLRRMSVPVIDSDDLARQLVQPGFPALAEIIQGFGPDYVDQHGNLNRPLLARRVFSDATSRKTLEEILHPRIEAGWKQAADVWKDQGSRLGCVIIPLLFEKGYQQSFEATVCMACTGIEQQRRLTARGWSPGEIQSRLASQWSTEQKMSLSQFVVWTEGSIETQKPQWKRILESFSGN